MSRTIFISDLHLAEERPETTERFARFLAGTVPGCDALYILGDLFEFWIGDDGIVLPLPARVAGLLRGVTKATPTYFMHGNRDFMVAERFCAETGVRLLPDPTVTDLYGNPTVLLHGDTLCTDDSAYQEYRARVRDARWQEAALRMPMAQRIKVAQDMRMRSEGAKEGKGETIMDVSPGAVEQAFIASGCHRMIHGHTHRPARHEQWAGGEKCTRWVLPDWYEGGGYLEVTATGERALTLD